MNQKISASILKGFQMVGGQQTKFSYYDGLDPEKPLAVCVGGAVGLAERGRASLGSIFHDERALRFQRSWGMSMADLNDEGLPWEHIYGMARAVDL